MSGGFDAVPRPPGRDLSGEELLEFVRELSARPELWIDQVCHDAGQRRYEQLIDDEHLTAWLICWMDDHDTGFHDHDASSGAVAVVSGHVREQRLALGGDPRDRVYAAGASFCFTPADIHRVTHAGSGPAVTIHVYSPPLKQMGSYVVEDDGVLTRVTVPSSEELRPLDSGVAAAH